MCLQYLSACKYSNVCLWVIFQNRTLLLEDELLRVRRIANPRVPRHIAGSVVRHTDSVQPMLGGARGGGDSSPSSSRMESRRKPQFAETAQPPSRAALSDPPPDYSRVYEDSPPSPSRVIGRRRPQFMRSPEIPAPLATMEGSRLSGASEGFDIGPDMVHRDDHDQETVV